MAQKKFPELPAAASIDENTLFAVDSGTQTFKATADVVADYIAGRAETLAQKQLKRLIVSNWQNVQDFPNRGTDFPGTFRSIAYSPTTGIAVAVSRNVDTSGRAILASTNQLNSWIATSYGSANDNNYNRVIHAPNWNRFYIIGQDGSGNGVIAHTPHTSGTAYTTLTSSLGSKPLYDMAIDTANNRAVVVSPSSDSTAAMITTDGTNFTNVITPAGLGFQAAAYSPSLGRFVIGGFNGQIAWSDDGGATWDDITVSGLTTEAIVKIIWVPSLAIFVAVGVDGLILTSANGEDWTIKNLGGLAPLGSYFRDIAYSPELKIFLATLDGAAGGRLWFSEDADTWEVINLANTASSVALYQAIAWLPGVNKFLIGGGTNVSEFLIGKSLTMPGF